VNIKYRSHYFEDADAKASFERYAKAIHNLDFSQWKSRGLWDENYTAFSAFISGECIASLCVYPLDMIIGGIKKKGAQLLTVGTLPGYRSKGIQREIWQRAKAWIDKKYDFTFLFTDDSAAGFYEKLGLKRQNEYYETIKHPLLDMDRIPPVTKLNMDIDNDFGLVSRLSKERSMVSERIGFNNHNLLMFMILYQYRNQCYYLNNFDCLVIVEEAESRICIHDIVTKRMPRFTDIELFLSYFEKDEIDFLFCADILGIPQSEKKKEEDSILLVNREFQMDGTFIFPYSLRAWL